VIDDNSAAWWNPVTWFSRSSLFEGSHWEHVISEVVFSSFPFPPPCMYLVVSVFLMLC